MMFIKRWWYFRSAIVSTRLAQFVWNKSIESTYKLQLYLASCARKQVEKDDFEMGAIYLRGQSGICDTYSAILESFIESSMVVIDRLRFISVTSTALAGMCDNYGDEEE